MPPAVPTCLGKRGVSPGEHLSEGLPRGFVLRNLAQCLSRGLHASLHGGRGLRLGVFDGRGVLSEVSLPVVSLRVKT